MQNNYRSNGKLLITGEYFVLDGAQALALPTQLGQSLKIEDNGMINWLHWSSYDEKGKMWFWGGFEFKTLKILDCSDEEIAKRLQQILKAIQAIHPKLFKRKKGVDFKTELDFARDWGLGTSSTLIYNLSEWAEMDPFELLEKTFGGSGYDIACAGADRPILYQKLDGKPYWVNCDFAPSFSENIYFIYLGRKQNSRKGIARYRELIKKDNTLHEEISNLTNQFLHCQNLPDFEKLIIEHESIISKSLELNRAKTVYFKDFWGEIKSLGAWGGDFVLATSDRSFEETKAYFNEKGFKVFLKYQELILNTSK